MFEVQAEPFGNLQSFILQDATGNYRLQVLPAISGAITDLVLSGTALVSGYRSSETAQEGRGSKGIFLFPFPNRLQDGIYEWKGKTYQFPITEVDRKNALHGFRNGMLFRVSGHQANESGAILHCQSDYRGDHPAWPFPCRITHDYQLEKKGMSITTSVENTGAGEIPFGLGWHPYFDLGQHINELLIQLPKVSLVEVDERMLPTGRQDFNDFSKPEHLGASSLDTCFEVQKKQGRVEVIVAGTRGTLRYWQEVEGYGFIQLFTTSDRRSLAIEPMSCNINAFQNEEGLAVLKPGETRKFAFGVKWEPSV